MNRGLSGELAGVAARESRHAGIAWSTAASCWPASTNSAGLPIATDFCLRRMGSTSVGWVEQLRTSINVWKSAFHTAIMP